jgi:hypothetical protein
VQSKKKGEGMTEHPQQNDTLDRSPALQHQNMMTLFDELTFRQKWKRVCAGLRQPVNSGQHKWARLQIIRLLSPIAAVVVPLLLLLLIAVLAQIQPEPVPPSYRITLAQPEPPDIPEPPEQPKIEPPHMPDFPDVVIDVAFDPPTQPENASPPPPNPSKVVMESFQPVSRIRNIVGMSELISTRTTDSQDKALREHVAEHTSESVLRALRWLAKNQHSDGSWGSDKPAMVSLALLAYLAHGETPASEEFGPTVEKALRFLTEAQQPDGRFRGRDGHDYTQPIAAYALAEAYGMTQIPILKETAIKAIQVVIKGQNPSGSFNYGLVPGGSDRDDLSYAGWCVQALKAAGIAGLESEVPAIASAKEKAINGIKSHYRTESDKGYFGYGPAGQGSRGLTGVGVLSLQFLGDGNSPKVKMGMQGMQDWTFNWQQPPKGSPLYYWYYMTQAYFQTGGNAWKQWNHAFSHGLVEEQQIQLREQSGYVDQTGQPRETGFWKSPSENEHNANNNEVMDTILCTLMLEVYYRYLPTFQTTPGKSILEELGDKEDLKINIVAI